MATIDKIRIKSTQQTYDITLPGLTASVTELNYTDGVTSSIQTQLNSKLDGSSTINVNKISGLADVATSGSYSDLINKPTASSLGALTADSTLSAAKLDGKITDGVTAQQQALGDTSDKVATDSFVQAAINNVLTASKAMTYEGLVPSAEWTAAQTDHTVGDTFVVNTDGTYVGVACKVNDMIICKTTGTIASDGHWNVVHAAGGSINGPSSSTAGHVVTFSNNTGNGIQDSGFTIGTSVPANAEFTDTTYGISGGANVVNLVAGGSGTSVEIYSQEWNNGNTLTLASGNWTASGDWFVQSLSLTGMSANYYPTLIPVYSSKAAVETVNGALGKVAYIETATNSITAYATEAPDADITFKLTGK